MERLDKHFEKLTKASFARYGFAFGELMSRWPEIVGETPSAYRATHPPMVAPNCFQLAATRPW